ncbi:MAG TPA: hypothetical protein VKM55_19775 [Candidatus Lokiarchaeia archaeon]|nr:hypothetical protein [Candidatus Lokiarchaeia archaeon]
MSLPNLKGMLAEFNSLESSLQKKIDYAYQKYARPEFYDLAFDDIYFEATFKKYMKLKSNFEQLMGHLDVTLDNLTRGERLSRFSTAEKIIAQIEKAIAILDNEIQTFSTPMKSDKNEVVENEINDRQEAIDKCLLICERFHLAALQLRERRKGKPPLLIENEFDVQYLFRAMMKIFFDDLRHEEPTPSHAGSYALMDFLLKEERISVEAKMASELYKDNKIGNDLLLDIARYKKHQDCMVLICLIYDPNDCISNPSALENDLNNESDDTLQVIAKVVPKRA